MEVFTRVWMPARFLVVSARDPVWVESERNLAQLKPDLIINLSKAPTPRSMLSAVREIRRVMCQGRRVKGLAVWGSGRSGV